MCTIMIVAHIFNVFLWGLFTWHVPCVRHHKQWVHSSTTSLYSLSEEQRAPKTKIINFTWSFFQCFIYTHFIVCVWLDLATLSDLIKYEKKCNTSLAFIPLIACNGFIFFQWSEWFTENKKTAANAHPEACQLITAFSYTFDLFLYP